MSATQAAKEARKLYRVLGEPLGEVNSLHFAAKACLGRSDTKEAVIHAEEALNIAKRLRDKSIEGQTQLLVAEMYYSDGRLEAAKKCAKDAQNIANDINVLEMAQEASRYLETIGEAILTWQGYDNSNASVYDYAKTKYGGSSGNQALPGTGKVGRSVAGVRAQQGSGVPGRAGPAQKVAPKKKEVRPEQLFNRQHFGWTSVQKAQAQKS